MNGPAPTFELPSRYSVLDANLASGGFGSVAKLQDRFLDRAVLFKTIIDADHSDQLLREVRALSRLRSRHVVDIYDVIQDRNGQIAGMVIEYLTGRDYSSFHSEAAKNAYAYMRTLYQLAAAISDLHAAGIVHRDIKLENLKDSAAGILKLFDFGLSSPTGGYQTVNNRGTYVYAAPELFVKGATITPEMDVYAFGVCAWALAAPTWPTELCERPPQSSSKVCSISKALPQLPTEIANLIDLSLSVDPRERPPASDLATLLAKVLVRNSHRGNFIESNRSIYELSQQKTGVKLTIGNLGELRVAYDGLVFRVTAVSVGVYANNVQLAAGMVLHDSCVLTFGQPALGAQRQFVSFFSSHPEVVL